VLTAEERTILHRLAQVFQECAEPENIVTAPQRPQGERPKGEGLRAGDDYDQRGDTLALLLQHGWNIARTVGEGVRLTRPGKSHGTSATWNVIPCRFYVFS